MTDGVDLLSHPPAADSTISAIKNDKNKKSPIQLNVWSFLKSGVDLLSHPQKGSTISASRLNFSVRNGKRWTVLL